MKINKYLISIISILILLIIWKLFALFIGADIILPPPEIVLRSLIKTFISPNFLKIVTSTLIRGLIGFIISFACGIIIGTLAGIFKGFRYFVNPVISFIRSTPVISVILLALIWFKVENVPIFVAFLMAFPIICGNIIEGITTVDRDLIEMANVYKVSFKSKILQIYLPSIVPFIIASASMSIGIIWKVIIAAEVLSQPKWAIGTKLSEARDFLITEEVFAWTVLAIFLSAISEVIFKRISKCLSWRE